ncbi:MAG: flippase [Candidatus Nitrospinota bacterium M3_3B_026]
MTGGHRKSLVGAIAGRLPWIGEWDPHMREVARGAFVFMLLRVAGAGLNFAFNLALARLLGVDGSGVFFLALTITTVSATLGCLGLGQTLMRFTAAYAPAGEWNKVAGAYRIGVRLAAGVSLSVTAAVVLAAPWLAGLFAEHSLAAPLRVMALGIFPLSMITIHAELLRGLKRARDSVLVMGVGVPFSALVLLAMVRASFGVTGAAAAYTAAAMAVGLMGFFLWRRAAPGIRGVRGNFDRRLLIETSLPIFWVSAVNIFNSAVGTVVLGIWADSAAVGVFNIAFRTAMLTGIFLVAINGLAAPKFAELHARRDFDALRKVARDAAKLVTLAAAPLQALFMLAPGFVLGLFGPEFEDGAAALVIMSIGQFVNVATGSVGYLLMMSGNEKLLRNTTLAFAVVNIALAVALIPPLGVTGAALAAAVSLAGTHITSAILVYRRLAILTLPVPDRFLRQ